MAIDDSFKRPGAVPFKWEIRPGVPKIQYQLKPQEKKLRLSPPVLPSPSPPFNPRRRPSPSPSPQHKLKPPSPGGFTLASPLEPRTRSFRSAPRSRSERWRFEQPARVRTECVSPGCFPSPLLMMRKGSRKSSVRTPQREYASDLDTPVRWSVSSRRSVSPFRDSPTTSSSFSYSSYQSSPRLVGDADWAGFGLF